MKFKQDRYRNARGGRAQLLDLTCEHCGRHVCYYQKDGPGVLMRLYFDRMFDANPVDDELVCQGCNRLIGVKVMFHREPRLAYRLFAGAVVKRRANLSELTRP